ncbi:hypothetical protein BJ875DRAFT_243214 [Amylocarpus encephaloides]|uniref:Uncharacterized protein n=1 Tax=Amylocarpus encephaloides TaxID=45428 RepID=A0A9P7YTU2_9HELO|nr:hypothetical protein BJ875DRAFT_243214 [Amylocarpus encephaloides]
MEILYELSQATLPFDHVGTDFLAKPQKWTTFDLLRFIAIIGPISTIIDMITLCLNYFFYNLRDGNDVVGMRMFQAHWFLKGVTTQKIIQHTSD